MVSIEQEAAEYYDRRCEEEIKQEAAKAAEINATLTRKSSTARELLTLFESENINTIAYLGADIGALNKVRERFRKHQRVRELCEYFIRINQAEIEVIERAIEHDRRTIKDLTRV